MFRPPYLNRFLHLKFSMVFHGLLSQLSLKECILLWNFNVNVLKRSHYSELKSILQLFGFTHLIHTQTRITDDMESLIDIIASNNCASVKDITIIPATSLITNLLNVSGNLITWSSLKKQLHARIIDLMILPNLVNICPRLIGTQFKIVMTSILLWILWWTYYQLCLIALVKMFTAAVCQDKITWVPDTNSCEKPENLKCFPQRGVQTETQWDKPKD